MQQKKIGIFGPWLGADGERLYMGIGARGNEKSCLSLRMGIGVVKAIFCYRLVM